MRLYIYMNDVYGGGSMGVGKALSEELCGLGNEYIRTILRYDWTEYAARK